MLLGAKRVWEEILNNNDIQGIFVLQDNVIRTNLTEEQVKELGFPKGYYYDAKEQEITNKHHTETGAYETILVSFKK